MRPHPQVVSVSEAFYAPTVIGCLSTLGRLLYVCGVQVDAQTWSMCASSPYCRGPYKPSALRLHSDPASELYC